MKKSNNALLQIPALELRGSKRSLAECHRLVRAAQRRALSRAMTLAFRSDYRYNFGGAEWQRYIEAEIQVLNALFGKSKGEIRELLNEFAAWIRWYDPYQKLATLIYGF